MLRNNKDSNEILVILKEIKMKKIYIIFLCFVSVLFSDTRTADLVPSDVVQTAHMMMAYHPSYKNMNEDLARRVMISFCEELDPLKSYLWHGRYGSRR